MDGCSGCRKPYRHGGALFLRRTDDGIGRLQHRGQRRSFGDIGGGQAGCQRAPLPIGAQVMLRDGCLRIRFLRREPLTSGSVRHRWERG